MAHIGGLCFLYAGADAADGRVLVERGGLIRIDGDVFLAYDTIQTDQKTASLTVNGTGAVEARNISVGSAVDDAVTSKDAFLSGTGTLRASSSVVLNDRGQIRPGSGAGFVGTLSIDGDFVSNSGGVLEIDALEDGTGDLLSITGTATLNGGTVRSLSPDGEWSVARQYTILFADGGVVGTFDDVTTNLAYLIPSLSYTANSVQLTLERLGAPVQEDILEESNAQQVSVTSRTVSTVIQSQVSSTVAAAFGVGASAATAYVPGSISTGLSAGDDMSSGNVWMNFTPSKYQSDALLPGSNTLQSIDGTSWNLLIGADQLIAKRVVVGAYAGAESSDIDIDLISGELENDGFMLGGYIGLALNDMFYMSVNGNYAWLDNAIEEQAFGSPTAVKGDYSSNRYALGADLNAVKVINQFDLRGQIGYNYTREKYDSYITSLGDRAAPEDQKLGRARLALVASYLGEKLRPYLSVAYENDVETSVDLEDDDGWLVYAGIRSAAFKEGLTLEAFLSAVVGRDDQNHNMLGLNLHYAW